MNTEPTSCQDFKKDRNKSFREHKENIVNEIGGRENMLILFRSSEDRSALYQATFEDKNNPEKSNHTKRVKELIATYKEAIEVHKTTLTVK
jgi:hypothetical protein